jgi:hypothetical protein
MNTRYITRGTDNKINADYGLPQSFTTEPIDTESAEYQAWINPPPGPDWEGFVGEFTSPGNALYNSVRDLVEPCTFLTRDHWVNLKNFISTPSPNRVSATVLLGVQYLKQLLATDGHPLTAQLIADWNTLQAKYYLNVTLS